MKTFDVVVWFEYDSLPPERHRFSLVSSGAHIAASRAIKLARKASAHPRATSILVNIDGVAPDRPQAIVTEPQAPAVQ